MNQHIDTPHQPQRFEEPERRPSIWKRALVGSGLTAGIASGLTGFFVILAGGPVWLCAVLGVIITLGSFTFWGMLVPDER